MWQLKGTCGDIDPEIFFSTHPDDIHDAKAVCTTCPVQAECFAFAISMKVTDGIWAGLTIDEIKALRAQARKKLA